MYSINKKDTILITGATSGLGWNLSKYFADKGHPIVITGRNDIVLDEMEKYLPTDVYTICGDLRNTDVLLKIVRLSKENNVSVLVNNAGVVCPGLKIEDLSTDGITEMIDVNLKVPFLLTRMMYDNLADIININSMVGIEPKKFRTAYTASKWGLRGFTNSLRMESDKNIVEVYPTRIETYPGRKNSMNVDFVCEKIYNSYDSKLNDDLILDGRLK